MRESYIQAAVVKYARQTLGVQAVKLSTMAYRSFPDFLFFIPGGVPLLIEFKAPGAKPTLLQRACHEDLAKADYETKIIDNVVEGKRAILTACLKTCFDAAEFEQLCRSELARLPAPGDVGTGAVHGRGKRLAPRASKRRGAVGAGDAQDIDNTGGVLRAAKRA